jgi:hypothetical protein
MSGQAGNAPDEAARLEAALGRIAQATARMQAHMHAEARVEEIPPAARSFSVPAPQANQADLAQRVDALIAELRGVLGMNGHDP